jgi:hypothetical protein
MRGIYEYAIEMGSAAMIYIASFIKIGSGIQNLIREEWSHRHTSTQAYRHTDSMEVL